MRETFDDIDALLAAIQPVAANPIYSQQFGDDIRATGTSSSQKNYGTPTPTYRRNELVAAADQIKNSGNELVQGRNFYNTGIDELNEILYGADYSRNMNTGQVGWDIPRNLRVSTADRVGAATKGILAGIATAGVGGALAPFISGALGTSAGIGQGIANAGISLATNGDVGSAGLAALAPVAGQWANNLAPAADVVREGVNQASVLDQIRGALDVYNDARGGIDDLNDDRRGDVAWQPVDVTDVLGDVQVQVPNYQIPQQNAGGGGGGGGNSAPTRPSVPANDVLTTGGTPGTDEVGRSEEPLDEDRWTWNGNVLVNTSTGATRQVPNPSRLEEGVIYNGDAEPVASDDEDNTAVFGSNDPLINPATGEPYVVNSSAPPAQNGMQDDTGSGEDGGQGDGQGSGQEIGSGTGTGGGNGSGDGPGDGDGEGDGDDEGQRRAGMSALLGLMNQQQTVTPEETELADIGNPYDWVNRFADAAQEIRFGRESERVTADNKMDMIATFVADGYSQEDAEDLAEQALGIDGDDSL